MSRRRNIIIALIFITVGFGCWFGWGYVAGHEVEVLYMNTVTPDQAKQASMKITKEQQTSCRYVYATDTYSGKVIKTFTQCNLKIYTNGFYVRSLIKQLEQNNAVIKAGFPRDFIDRTHEY